MAKFYAVGYTNGGANEKRLGPYNSMDEARKAGMREQGATRGFAFAGVVGEDGNYVYSNSRACNAQFKPGDVVGIKIMDGGKRDWVVIREQPNGYLVLTPADNPWKAIERIYQGHGLISKGRTMEVPNSRACNSSNPVVQKALNATRQPVC